MERNGGQRIFHTRRRYLAIAIAAVAAIAPAISGSAQSHAVHHAANRGLVVSPPSVRLPNAFAGESNGSGFNISTSYNVVKLTNTFTDSITIARIAAEGFSAAGNCVKVLKPNETCEFPVGFSPLSSRAIAGQLS